MFVRKFDFEMLQSQIADLNDFANQVDENTFANFVAINRLWEAVANLEAVVYKAAAKPVRRQPEPESKQLKAKPTNASQGAGKANPTRTTKKA